MVSRYSDEFREEAVNLVVGGNLSIPKVARDLGVSVWTLRDWVKKFHEKTGSSGAPRPESLEDENRRLKRENAVLRQEREILKKAAAYFAKEQF